MASAWLDPTIESASDVPSKLTWSLWMSQLLNVQAKTIRQIIGRLADHQGCHRSSPNPTAASTAETRGSEQMTATTLDWLWPTRPACAIVPALGKAEVGDDNTRDQRHLKLYACRSRGHRCVRLQYTAGTGVRRPGSLRHGNSMMSTSQKLLLLPGTMAKTPYRSSRPMRTPISMLLAGPSRTGAKMIV